MILLAFGMILRVLGGIELLLIGTGITGIGIVICECAIDSVDQSKASTENWPDDGINGNYHVTFRQLLRQGCRCLLQ